MPNGQTGADFSIPVEYYANGCESGSLAAPQQSPRGVVEIGKGDWPLAIAKFSAVIDHGFVRSI